MDRAPPPTMTSTPALKEGWLVKQGGHYRSWKRRWFVLKGNFLSYAKDKGKEPVGRITFNIIKGTEVATDYTRGKRVYFRILVAESDRPGGAYLLGADNEEVMNSWLEVINAAWEKYKSKSEGISNVSLSSDSVGPAIQPQALPSPAAGAGAVARESSPSREAPLSSSPADPSVALNTPVKKFSEDVKKRRHSTQSASRLNRVLSQKAFNKITKEDAPDAGQEAASNEDQVLDELQKAKALYDAVASGNRGAAVAWMQLGVDVNWANDQQGGRTALHVAMYRGDVMSVEELLKHGADPGTSDEEGITPIHLAAHHGHKSCLEVVVAGDVEMIDRHDNANRTPIYMALTAGHREIAKDLIKIAIDEEMGKWRKYHLLAIAGDLSGLEEMLADEIDDTNPLKPIAPADCDITPIHLAAAGGHFDVLAFLLSKARGGANCITVLDSFKRAPLHFAVGSGDATFVSRLVKIGAVVDLQDSYGKTALHFAAGLGQHETAKVLLAEHSAKYLTDNSKFTPLHLACVHGRTEVVELLLQRKVAKANEVGAGDITPLFLAAHHGHSSCIEVLLRHDVDINQQTQGGLTALHEAARRENRSSLQLLLSSKCHTDVLDKNGETPLFAATRSGSVECVSLLLEAGASHQVKNSAGESLLTIAAASGDAELVATFLDQGMDPSETAAGTTPLTVAATAGLKYVAKVLLSSGADTSSVDAAGDTAVHHAVRGGHSDVLCELIDFGADIRCQNKDQATPAHVAAEHGRRECLEVLLANGAPPNAKDANGATPLHLAAARGNLACLQRLILFGGKVQSKNNLGMTPCNEAANHRKLKSTLLLIAHGASVDKETTDILKTAMKALTKKKKKAASKKARRKKVPHSVAVAMAPIRVESDQAVIPRPIDRTPVEDRREVVEEAVNQAEEEALTEQEEDTDVMVEEETEEEHDDESIPDLESPSVPHTAAAAIPPPIASVEAAALPPPIAEMRTEDQPAAEAPTEAGEATREVADEEAATEGQSAAEGEAASEGEGALAEEGAPATKEEGTAEMASITEETPTEATNPQVVTDSTEMAAATTAPPAPQLTEQELAKQYIVQAQKLLSKADYKAFHMLLREYKAESLSVAVLFERLCALFSTEEKKTLLKGFVTFVPPASQAQYSKLVAEQCG